MAFFKKNKKNEAPVEEVQGAAATDNQVSTQGKKKKKKDMMSSILSESVVESALEEMRANKNCIADRDGDTVYVGMLLKADDIGGINKKSQRDEAKGTIIELINSGRIQTYIPADLLAAEQIVIIPEVTTIDAMDEFSLLTTAPYTIAIVNEKGDVENTGKAITYDEVSRFVATDGDIYDLLADAGIEWAHGDVKDEESYDEPEDEFLDEGEDDFVPDEDETFDPDSEDEFEEGDEFEDEPAYEDEVPSEDYPEDDSFVGDEDEAPAEEMEEDEDEIVEVSDADMKNAVTRKFYSDDLGLTAPLEPFEAQFMRNNPYIPFDENRGEGWLNEYVSQMSKDANIEMKRMHESNLFALRAHYARLLDIHVEKIDKMLDKKAPETQYGAFMDALKEQRVQQREELPRKVSVKRQELESVWDKALEQVGEDAKREAQSRYRERYINQHNESIYKIEPQLLTQIENDYADSVREMDERRKEDASRLLDYGITEILRDISEEYAAKLEEETAEYKAWRTRINEFIDNNRKDEIAHDKVLAEELAQSQKADKVLAEYTEKLNASAAEFEAKRQELAAEIAKTEKDADDRIRTLRIECDKRISDMANENAELKNELNVLMTKYADLDHKKEEKFEGRVSEAMAEKDIWMSKYDNIVSLQKRHNIVTVALATVAVIAALAIGTLVGTNMNLDFGSKSSVQQIEQDFNDRMDSIEKKQAEDKETSSDDKTTDSATETPAKDSNSNQELEND